MLFIDDKIIVALTNSICIFDIETGERVSKTKIYGKVDNLTKGPDHTFFVTFDNVNSDNRGTILKIGESFIDEQDL